LLGIVCLARAATNEKPNIVFIPDTVIQIHGQPAGGAVLIKATIAYEF
jgi:hypothetical protein